MSSQLDYIPTELSKLIEVYGIPMLCANCEKYSFAVKKCGINSDHILCYDCMLKCSDCNCFISNFRQWRREEIKIPMAELIKLHPCRLCKTSVKYHDAHVVMNNPTNFYTFGENCYTCKKVISKHCLYKIYNDPNSTYNDIAGRVHYKCYDCARKCLKCYRVINRYTYDICRDCRSDEKIDLIRFY